MRPNRFLLLALPLFLFACRPSFDVTVTASSTIMASPIPGANLLPFNFANFGSLDISQTADFKNQGINKDQLDSVKLKSAVLTITAPSGAKFDFLNGIEFDATAQGQPQVRVAELSPVDHSQSTINLNVDDTELLPYVAAPSMSVTTSVMGAPPSNDTTVQATLVFTVVPKL